MAKKSAVERNDKRKRMVEKYAAKREELKAIALNEDLPLEERFKARLKLNELPKNGTKIRVRNRCSVTGRPRGARKHKQNIEPLGSRWAKYKVKKSLLTGKTPYKINAKMIAGMIPINLINEIKVVGFDYYMSPRDIAEGVLAGHQVLWEKNWQVGPGGQIAALEDKTEPAGGEE